MHFMARALVVATVFLTIAFSSSTVSRGQDSSPSATPLPTSSPVDTTASNTKTEAQDPANTAAPKPTNPAPSPEPTDLWHQETMTGDWGGTRSRWKEKGVELEFELSNFVQGVAAGGVRHDTEFNGKFEMTWKFDLGKVAGWKFWSTEIKTEFRYGGPVLGGTGALNPVNTATLTPAADGETVAITAVNFTRIIPKDLKKGDLYVVSFGRYNLLDLLDEDFFGGFGTDRFFNIAQI